MIGHASVLPAGTPPSAFGKLLAAEARYQWRVPFGLIVGIGVPLLLVIIFGLVPSANTRMSRWAASPSSAGTSLPCSRSH